MKDCRKDMFILDGTVSVIFSLTAGLCGRLTEIFADGQAYWY